jgi:hypothetical protein
MQNMQDAMQIIIQLNNDFYERTKNSKWTPFSLETDGSEYRIMFLGFPIFSSAADRITEEAGETGEALEDFVKQSASEMMYEISMFHNYF